jgi:hypothetical protein
MATGLLESFRDFIGCVSLCRVRQKSGSSTILASARVTRRGFSQIADTTVTWSATWEMSAGSPVIDDVHLQLCRARLVLNQQTRAARLQPIAPANEVRKLEDWMK